MQEERDSDFSVDKWPALVAETLHACETFDEWSDAVEYLDGEYGGTNQGSLDEHGDNASLILLCQAALESYDATDLPVCMDRLDGFERVHDEP